MNHVESVEDDTDGNDIVLVDTSMEDNEEETEVEAEG